MSRCQKIHGLTNIEKFNDFSRNIVLIRRNMQIKDFKGVNYTMVLFTSCSLSHTF